MLRRALAIALLIAFGSPLVAPLFAATADPEASLPACCRSHGKHHCAMMHLMLAEPRGAAFQAPPCPFYPAPATPIRLATASTGSSLQLRVQLIRATAPLIASRGRTQTLAVGANLQRGPPAQLA